MNQLLFYQIIPFLIFLCACLAEESRICHGIDSTRDFCLIRDKESTLGVEILQKNQLAPLEAFYFYKAKGLMTRVDWEKEFFLHLSENGEKLEILNEKNYQMFQQGEEVLDCDGDECFSPDYEFLDPDKIHVRPGDILFSTDLSPYSPHIRSLFSHVSIVSGVEGEQVQVASNDMGSTVKILPLSEVLKNCISFAVLRNTAFSQHLTDQNKIKPGSTPLPFCTSFLVRLLNQFDPKILGGLPTFDRIHPEFLFHRLRGRFEVISSQLPTGSLPDLKERYDELVRQEQEWYQSLKDPQLTLYSLFKSWFPFTPVDFDRDRIHRLLGFAQSGLMMEEPRTTRLKPFTFSKQMTSTAKPKFGSPKQPLCFQRMNSRKLCEIHYENGNLRLVEEFLTGGVRPDRGLYFDSRGALHTYIDYEKKFYFKLDTNGNLLAHKNEEKYRRFDTQVVCQKGLCVKKGEHRVRLPADKLQFGDVIFAGNLFDYSAHTKRKITHISISLGKRDGVDLVLTNDIAQKLSETPLKSAHRNTLHYVILRNPEFSRIFRKAVESPYFKLMPVPYFCANLYASIFSKMRPGKTSAWDQFDRNHAERIFFNTVDEFEVVDFKVQGFENLKQFKNAQIPDLDMVHSQIPLVMEHPNVLLERLFALDFELLPISFRPGVVSAVMQVLVIHHPFEYKTSPLE